MDQRKNSLLNKVRNENSAYIKYNEVIRLNDEIEPRQINIDLELEKLLEEIIKSFEKKTPQDIEEASVKLNLEVEIWHNVIYNLNGSIASSNYILKRDIVGHLQFYIKNATRLEMHEDEKNDLTRINVLKSKVKGPTEQSNFLIIIPIIIWVLINKYTLGLIAQDENARWYHIFTGSLGSSVNGFIALYYVIISIINWPALMGFISFLISEYSAFVCRAELQDIKANRRATNRLENIPELNKIQGLVLRK